MQLSVILPVYNECNRLEACIRLVDEYLSREFSAYEIIIAEDNSTDGSYAIARDIAAGNPKVVLLHNEARLGRGASLREAIRRCRSDYVVYMDVDLATDLSYTKRLVEGLERGAAVSTGSRLMKDSNASRPLARDVASRSYNLMARVLFSSKVHDHQCGFKGFNKKCVLPLLGVIGDNHWFWDTELLIICQMNGLPIDEFPVTWLHNGGNNLNPSKVKVLKDARYMGTRLLKLKLRTLKGNKAMADGSGDTSGGVR